MSSSLSSQEMNLSYTNKLIDLFQKTFKIIEDPMIRRFYSVKERKSKSWSKFKEVVGHFLKSYDLDDFKAVPYALSITEHSKQNSGIFGKLKYKMSKTYWKKFDEHMAFFLSQQSKQNEYDRSVKSNEDFDKYMNDVLSNDAYPLKGRNYSNVSSIHKQNPRVKRDTSPTDPIVPSEQTEKGGAALEELTERVTKNLERHGKKLIKSYLKNENEAALKNMLGVFVGENASISEFNNGLVDSVYSLPDNEELKNAHESLIMPLASMYFGISQGKENLDLLVCDDLNKKTYFLNNEDGGLFLVSDLSNVEKIKGMFGSNNTYFVYVKKYEGGDNVVYTQAMNDIQPQKDGEPVSVKDYDLPHDELTTLTILSQIYRNFTVSNEGRDNYSSASLEGEMSDRPVTVYLNEHKFSVNAEKLTYHGTINT